MKHPRAANFAWNCENGKYLYWFHNHGGTLHRRGIPSEGRLRMMTAIPPGFAAAWRSTAPRAESSGGHSPRSSSTTTTPIVRMSYPDLIEEDGRYFLTETQKDLARVHELDPALLARDVPQPVLRGRARAGGGHLRHRHRPATTSWARRWACRSTSFWAASTATRCPALPRSAAAPAAELIERRQELLSPGLERDPHRHRPSRLRTTAASTSRASPSASRPSG